MERAHSSEEGKSRTSIIVPPGTLIVLCGPAGSGKSTFAQKLVDIHKHKGFKPTMIVSSDNCRAMVCDDETNQKVHRDAFDLFHYIIHKRMFQGRLTIADSTALQTEARRRLLELAQRYHYYTCLLICNTSPGICLQRNQKRQRLVEEQVIIYHLGLLQQVILDAPKESWNQLHILSEQDMDTGIEIVIN